VAYQATLNRIASQQDDPIDLQLSKATPHLTEMVKAGFDSVNANFASSRADLAAIVKSEVAQIFTTPLFLTRDASLSTRQQPTPSTNSSGSSRPPSTTEYTLSRRLRTVVEVWREYEDGLSGGPAVQRLELEHGTAWRKDRMESKYFSRRKVLYDEVQSIAAVNAIPSREAAAMLEQRRLALGMSLDGLSTAIRRSAA
jgi:hypothetical protein